MYPALPHLSNQLDTPEGQQARTTVLEAIRRHRTPVLCDPTDLDFVTEPDPGYHKQRLAIITRWRYQVGLGLKTAAAVIVLGVLLVVVGALDWSETLVGMAAGGLAGVGLAAFSHFMASFFQKRHAAIIENLPQRSVHEISRDMEKINIFATSIDTTSKASIYPNMAGVLADQCESIEVVREALDVDMGIQELFHKQLGNIYNVHTNAQLETIDPNLLQRATDKLLDDMVTNQLLLGNLLRLHMAQTEYDTAIATAAGNAKLEELLGGHDSALDSSLEHAETLRLQIEALNELLDITP